MIAIFYTLIPSLGICQQHSWFLCGKHCTTSPHTHEPLPVSRPKITAWPEISVLPHIVSVHHVVIQKPVARSTGFLNVTASRIWARWILVIWLDVGAGYSVYWEMKTRQTDSAHSNADTIGNNFVLIKVKKPLYSFTKQKPNRSEEIDFPNFDFLDLTFSRDFVRALTLTSKSAEHESIANEKRTKEALFSFYK